MIPNQSYNIINNDFLCQEKSYQANPNYHVHTFSVRYFDGYDNQLPYYDSIYNDGHIISADDLFEARKKAVAFGKKYIPNFYWCEVLAL